tara:strand:- start:4610 stop:4750 length:141 start_codon:yes stop_codon:yes gene_type:complete
MISIKPFNPSQISNYTVAKTKFSIDVFLLMNSTNGDDLSRIGIGNL